MFYGSGAGKLPTASAVVADVVDEAKHLHRNIMTNWSSKPLALMDQRDVTGRYFVRVQGNPYERYCEVKAAFGDVEPITLEGRRDEFAFITSVMSQGEYEERSSMLSGILTMIRVKD